MTLAAEDILPEPERFRHVHMMGIGGIGMAGLARLLAARGFEVSGCDACPTELTRRLAADGIPAAAGHAAAHLGKPWADWVVFSPAVPPENGERRAAAELGIPCLRRGEVLPALAAGRRTLAVAGTHGKTTTSSMLLHALRGNGRAPGWCIGGEVWPDRWPGGEGGEDLLVVEADESDGTLARYRVATAVVASVEPDHLEHFSDYGDLLACFRTFLAAAGSRIVCADNPDAARLGAESGAVRYGIGAEGCRIGAGGLAFDAGGIDYTLRVDGADAGRFRLPLPGRHNLLDALGAIAAAETAGVEPAAAAAALATYRLPGRRMELAGEGRGIRVLSDYAHHPSEIRALLSAVRQTGPKRILAVFQPHRYTRTRAMAADFPPAFAGADRVLLLPVYAASEPPLEGGTSGDLARAWRAAPGAPPVETPADFAAAEERLAELWTPGDTVLLVGAGDIIRMAPRLAARLAE